MLVKDNISNKITEVTTEVQVVSDSIDDILDQINWFRKRLDIASEKLCRVSNSFTAYFSKETDTIELKQVTDQLRELVDICTETVDSLLQSKYSKDGFKSELDNFIIEVDSLRELLHDAEMRLKPLVVGSRAYDIMSRLNQRLA